MWYQWCTDVSDVPRDLRPRCLIFFPWPPAHSCLIPRSRNQRPLLPLIIRDRIPNNRLRAACARATMFIAPDTWLLLSLGSISRLWFALLSFSVPQRPCYHPLEKSQIHPWLKVYHVNQIPPSSAISLTRYKRTRGARVLCVQTRLWAFVIIIHSCSEHLTTSGDVPVLLLRTRCRGKVVRSD